MRTSIGRSRDGESDLERASDDPANDSTRLAIESGDRVIFELREDGAHLRVLKPTRLTDLYRSLPATRPYPGTGEIRDEVGRALGHEGPE